MGSFVRKANTKDLSRIAEIQVFNYRLFFYPIFKSDDYYFNELSVPSLMREYESGLDSLYVYDDGAVKGFIKIEGTYIARLFVEPVLQNASIGSRLLEYAIREHNADHLWALEKKRKSHTLLRKARVCFNRGEKTGRRNIRVSCSFKEEGITRNMSLKLYILKDSSNKGDSAAMSKREKLYGIHLTDDQRRSMMKEIESFWLDEFDEKTGLIKQQAVFDFFMERFAPSIYNRALDDAKAWCKRNMENLEDDYFTLYK